MQPMQQKILLLHQFIVTNNSIRMIILFDVSLSTDQRHFHTYLLPNTQVVFGPPVWSCRPFNRTTIAWAPRPNQVIFKGATSSPGGLAGPKTSLDQEVDLPTLRQEAEEKTSRHKRWALFLPTFVPRSDFLLVHLVNHGTARTNLATVLVHEK